jgi:hypothetical protein
LKALEQGMEIDLVPKALGRIVDILNIDKNSYALSR